MNKKNKIFPAVLYPAIFLLVVFISSGCSTYNYARGGESYAGGYVVLRNNNIIPEYTIGRKNTAPQELSLAKKRFGRRKDKVDRFYKKIGIFYSPFNSIVGYPRAFLGVLCGLFKLPFMIVSDYRYEHNPKYKEIIDSREEKRKMRQDEELDRLKQELNLFIEKDLEIEEELEKALQLK